MPQKRTRDFVGGQYAARDNTRVHTIPGTGLVPGSDKVPKSKHVDISDNPLGYLPVIGDVLQAGQAAIDLSEGRYGRAALGAGLLAVPNIVEKPIRHLVRGVQKTLRHTPADNILLREYSSDMPYRGRNIVYHSTGPEYLPESIVGDSRSMTPSLAVNRLEDFNDVYGTPFRFGDYTFIGDKSLLDDSVIYRGDGMTPTVIDITGKWDNVPSDMREQVAEELWNETLYGSKKGTGPKISVDELSTVDTPSADRYFEAVHHGAVDLSGMRHGIFPEPGTMPDLKSSKEAENIIRYFDNKGLPYTLYDKRLSPYGWYDDWAEKIIGYGTSNPDVLFKDGGKRRTLLKGVSGGSGGGMSGGRSGDQRKIAAGSSNKYERIGNGRYWMANDSLVRSGSSPEDADRLARILAAQSALEAGWTDDVKGNNFAGYMSNGKRMSFDSPDEFWDYHIRNLDEKWPGWRRADSVKAYYDIVNNTALGLDTKEKFDAYNRAHRDSPAYIYAPAWENSNYLANLSGVYDRYINKYVPALGNALSDGGDIHIKKSKRGTFTAAAKAHGKSVQAFASQVLANKGNYSPAMVKKANFARNFGGHKHSDGGYLLGGIYDLEEDKINELISLGYGIERL